MAIIKSRKKTKKHNKYKTPSNLKSHKKSIQNKRKDQIKPFFVKPSIVKTQAEWPNLEDSNFYQKVDQCLTGKTCPFNLTMKGVDNVKESGCGKPPPVIKLRNFQKVISKFINPNSPYKGLLLFHKLGSGKTCTSVLVADEMLREGKVDRVFILSPGSLRAGWIKEYCKVCGFSNDFLKALMGWDPA